MCAFFSKEGLDFLSELKLNNDKTWFETQKKRYENEVKKPFFEVVDTVAKGLREKQQLGDILTRKLIFRINRDVRFSKNKDPYKTFLGSYLDNKGTQSFDAAYYIHIEPNHCFIAAGLYDPNAAYLKSIRQEIVYETQTWCKAVEDIEVVKSWGGLRQDLKTYKKLPSEVADNPELSHYLLLKQFLLWKTVPDELVVSSEYPQYCLELFEKAIPMVQFLRKCKPE